jgi:GxxExxY protein
LEFINLGIPFKRELEQNIYYKNFDEPVGTRRVDFLVNEDIIVEIKAIVKLEDVHYAQVLNYLKAYKKEIGILINFGAKSVEYKRFVLSK